jgi:eukaryotic-like serine/threonine-protein kinase
MRLPRRSDRSMLTASMPMHRAEWQRVKAIFHEALERPEDRRAAYLVDTCGDDHELRQAVEALLAHDKAAASFMEQAAPGRIATTIASEVSEGGSAKQARPEIGIVGVLKQTLELSALLRKRLLALTFIHLAAFGLFYAGRFVRLDFTPDVIWRTMLPGGGYLLFMAVMSAAVWRARPSVLRPLRVYEAAIFGGTALFYMSEAYTVAFVDRWVMIYAERHPAEMSILARQTSILWLAHITAYGIFIPNTGRRCAAVTILMALGAISVPAIGGPVHHVPGRPMALYLSEMVMWLSVAVAMAVYGSQKITALREEALAARKLGQYQLKRRLGQGGMGEVYLAEHILLKRPCAVKIIRPEQALDTRTMQRFLREVQAAATLTHPNTVQVFDYGQASDGTMFYAMEYLTGMTLQELVDQHGAMSAGRAIFVWRQLCGALSEAHAVGLIHRDIKPSNVILSSRAGQHDVAKLLDFGLVRIVSSDPEDGRLTQAGLLFGTPEYMSPEQAAGAADVAARSDIYSLGALACFLLTGQPPFVRPSPAQTLAAHIDDPMALLRTRVADVPQDLEAIVLRCLQKRLQDRFAAVTELERALAACCSVGEWTQADAAAWSLMVGTRPVSDAPPDSLVRSIG